MPYIDRDHMRAVFYEFLLPFDKTNVKIERKIGHTFRVADRAEDIAKRLHCSDKLVDLAWTLGLVHDMGRFVQVQRYDTFNDSISLDHAQESVNLLYEEGWARRLGIPLEWDDIVKKAVANHSRLYVQKDDISDLERFMSHILRDADKIDIFELIGNTPFAVYHGCEEKLVQESKISEPVYRHVLFCQILPFTMVETKADFFLRLYGMYFDIVFPCSLDIIRERHSFDGVMKFRFTDKENQKKLEAIQEKVRSFSRMKV